MERYTISRDDRYHEAWLVAGLLLAFALSSQGLVLGFRLRQRRLLRRGVLVYAL